MGIFSEADSHPFDQRDTQPVDDSRHGGSGNEAWTDERRMSDFIRSAERPRGLFVRDDILLS